MCVYLVDLPRLFPTQCPVFTLQSVYHETVDGQPYSKVITDYPYSPRWTPGEMAERARYAGPLTLLISQLIVIFNLLWSEFVETNATFRSASTDLDHALVVCDMTQIPAEGSGCRWGGGIGIPDHDSLWSPVV